MKIRIVSDLHVDHWLPQREVRKLEITKTPIDHFFVPPSPEDSYSTLVIAGDFCEASRYWKAKTYSTVIENLCKRFHNVVYVLGNHDHYRGHLESSIEDVIEANQHNKNFHVLEKDSVIIDKVWFIGTTLWTDFDKQNPVKMQTALINDFNGLIKTGNLPRSRDFTTFDSVIEHQLCVDFIRHEVAAAKAEKFIPIVVTHHAPSYQSLDDKFKHPPLNHYNCCFMSDLDSMIEELQPAMWIHGHVHDAFDYNIGKTRILCNPFAYPGENGKNRWKPVKIVEIE